MKRIRTVNKLSRRAFAYCASQQAKIFAGQSRS